MGTNDFSYHQSTLGTSNINYDNLIFPKDSGGFEYATPQTSCEAYAIMLHKMIERYPNAEIYCMSLLPRRAEDYSGDSVKDPGLQPTQFNTELAQIVKHFGVYFVNLEHCGIVPDISIFDSYIPDKRVHPGKLGMDLMTEVLIEKMLNKDVSFCNIYSDYSGVTSDNSASTIIKGQSYHSNISLNEGFYNISVNILMSGQDITAESYKNGEIYIPVVNGDLIIRVSAVKKPTSYRWELKDNMLVNITTNGNSVNSLDMLGGTIVDGVLQGAYFRFDNDIFLRHDQPWVIEWCASGNWSGMILATKMVSTAEANIYIFKSNANSINLIAFGQRIGGLYENYGVGPGNYGIDTKSRHIYRLENRIADDGTNTIYLLIDSVNLGAMNNHYHGTTDQSNAVNWIGNQDFIFSYMGTNGHAMINCKLEYIEIHEGGDPNN